jgi:RimJ/RimL family protein N-acetyltransferase
MIWEAAMGMKFETQRFIVKEAGEDDLEYVMRLERAEENRDFVFQNTYEEHKSNIDSTENMLFIVQDRESSENAAFILCSYKIPYDSFELRRIVIETKCKGAGSELISALIKYSFEVVKANRFWLDVFTDNDRAVHLYKKLGMVHEGTLRQSYKDYSGRYRDQMIFSILNEEYVKR